MMNLILLNCHDKLQDQYAFFHLQLSPEVSVFAEICNAVHNVEIIQEHVNWAFNYDISKWTGLISIVIEVKKVENLWIELSQLLVYMAEVLMTRDDQTNQIVFEMLTDSGYFQFAFLDQNKKFYIFKMYDWAWEQSEILIYIDTILLDVIKSSSHMVLTESWNTTLMNYQQYLEKQWLFDNRSQDKMDEAINKGGIVDLISGEKNMAIRTVRHERAD